MPIALTQNWQNSGWWLFLTSWSKLRKFGLPRADCAVCTQCAPSVHPVCTSHEQIVLGPTLVAPGSDFRLEPRNSRTRRPPAKGSSWSQVLGCYYPFEVSLLQAVPWLTSPERLLRGKFTPSSFWRNFRGKSSSSFKYVKPA